MISMSLGFLHLTLVDILDIAIVAVLIYVAIRWIRGSSAMNIFIAIIILLVCRIIAVSIGMKMLSTLLGTILDVGAIALIIIFQPEIRRFLNRIGSSAGKTIGKRNFLHWILPSRKLVEFDGKDVDEIAQACMEMGEQKVGALIILRKRNNLEDVIATGDRIDARISSRLIQNIFFKNSPLHDGAMVIDDGRILAARCTLPISERPDLPASYGMRHKAAMGISEQTDADVIVVSEQTGRVSFVHESEVTVISSVNVLKLKIKGETEAGK